MIKNKVKYAEVIKSWDEMECLTIIGLLPETVTGAVEPWDEGGSIVPDVDWGSCGGISVLWDVGVRMVSAVVWSEYYF